MSCSIEEAFTKNGSMEPLVTLPFTLSSPNFTVVGEGSWAHGRSGSSNSLLDARLPSSLWKDGLGFPMERHAAPTLSVTARRTACFPSISFLKKCQLWCFVNSQFSIQATGQVHGQHGPPQWAHSHKFLADLGPTEGSVLGILGLKPGCSHLLLPFGRDPSVHVGIWTHWQVCWKRGRPRDR